MSIETTQKRQSKKSWLIGGGLIAVAGITVGVLVLQNALGARGPSTEQQSQVYRGVITRIEVDLDAGNLTIAGGDSGQASVGRVLKWDQTKPTITETLDGGTLRISEVCQHASGCSTDYTVTAPASVAVQVHIGAGNMTMRDQAGDLDLVSNAGNVELDNLGGKAHVRAGNGEIQGSGLKSSEVNAQTKSGAISLAFAAAPTTVDVTAGTGVIAIRVPAEAAGSGGYRVQAETSSGSRDISVDQQPNATRSITVHSSVGDVSVRQG